MIARPVAGGPGGARQAGYWWAEPAGFLAAVVGVLAVHAALRVLLGPALSIDDARETVYGQTLEWGYLARQPPLYNWLVWAAFRLLGVSVVSLTVVKYAFLTATYLFVYLAGRRIVGDGRIAALAALSLWLVIPINWVAHEGLTHSLAALAAAAAAFYALLRLEASGSRHAYLAFGLAMGLGFLAKFSFGVFAASLLVAALSLPDFRRRCLHPRIVLSLSVALALVLPFLLWFYAHQYSLGAMYTLEVHAEPRGGYVAGVGSGLLGLGRVLAYYLTPAGFVLLALFPQARRIPAVAPAARTPGGRLVARFLVAELGLLLAGVLVGGVTYLKFRWLLPAFFLVPLLWLSRVGPGPGAERGFRRYALLLAVAEAATLVAFVGNVYRGDRFGRPTRLSAPYDLVARELAQAGFRRGTIVAGDGPLAGNLRLHFPDSRVLGMANAGYVPPARGGGQCLVLWERGPEGEVPRELREWARAALGAELDRVVPIHRIEARYRFALTERVGVRFVLLSDGRGACR